MTEWQGYYVIALLMIRVGQGMDDGPLRWAWFFMGVCFAAVGLLRFLGVVG